MNLYDLQREYDLQHGYVMLFQKLGDQIHTLEVEKAQFAMEAKNAKDRAALLESLNKSLEAKNAALESLNKSLEAKNAALEEKQAALEKRIKVQDEGRELMKGRIGALEQEYQNACAVGDNLKEQMLKMVRQQENAELAAEALKAKLKRKNERIRRLEEANIGFFKGIQRLRKRIENMDQTGKIKDDGRREMRERIAELSEQNEQLRKNCDKATKEIFQLNELLRAYAWHFGKESAAQPGKGDKK